jgi:hypothetical protein
VKKIDVRLDSRLEPDGSVRCRLECDGQHAIVTFTGTDVLFDVPEPAKAAEKPEHMDPQQEPGYVPDDRPWDYVAGGQAIYGPGKAL